MLPRGNQYHLPSHFQSHLFHVLNFRNMPEGWKQTDKDKLLVMMKEYERYKDQWGLNLHYSRAAGPAKNFSELYLVFSYHLVLYPFDIFQWQKRN